MRLFYLGISHISFQDERFLQIIAQTESAEVLPLMKDELARIKIKNKLNGTEGVLDIATKIILKVLKHVTRYADDL